MGKIKGLPEKFNKLWQTTERLLEQAKPEEVAHTADMVKVVLECRGILRYDLDIFLPLAILHNIERIPVLNRYFSDIVITAELKNGKPIKLSAAENMVKSLSEGAGISPEKLEEIIAVLKVREKVRGLGPLEAAKRRKFYDTDNKKLFHDLHLLSRFNRQEVKAMKRGISDEDQFKKLIDERLNLFFDDKLRTVAEEKLRKIEGIRKTSSWSEH